MTSGHGGKRPGAGKKEGAVTRVSRDVANRIMADDGVTPLEVVITGMRQLYREAQVVDTAGKVTWDIPKLKDAIAAADRALPYCHARIASVDLPTAPPPGSDDESNALEDARRVAFLITMGAREAAKKKALPKLPRPKKRKA